jgi:hypothetical protein
LRLLFVRFPPTLPAGVNEFASGIVSAGLAFSGIGSVDDGVVNDDVYDGVVDDVYDDGVVNDDVYDGVVDDVYDDGVDDVSPNMFKLPNILDNKPSFFFESI